MFLCTFDYQCIVVVMRRWGLNVGVVRQTFFCVGDNMCLQEPADESASKSRRVTAAMMQQAIDDNDDDSSLDLSDL